MKMKLKLIIILFLSSVFFSSLYAQLTPPSSRKEGACYAKCQIAARIDTSYHEYFVYTGENPEDHRFVKFKKIITSQEMIVSRESDGKIMEEIQEEKSIILPIVTKKRKVEPQYIESREIEIITYSPESLGEWREVVCTHKVNEELISQIYNQLQDKGANFSEVHHTLNDEMKKALGAFQEKNGLPSGLSVESLKALGVELE